MNVYFGAMRMNQSTPLNDAALAELVSLFYAKVRADSLIGPLFNEAVDDWPLHLQRLTDFWSSVMTGSGRFKGNPMAVHLQHADAIRPEMFIRWLDIWRATVKENFDDDAAQALINRAERIAESLQLGLQFRRDGPGFEPIAKAKTPLKKALPQATQASPAQPASALTDAQPPAAHQPATAALSEAATPNTPLEAVTANTPYKSTPIFDEQSLPLALRREHRTKAGTWGVIRVLQGTLRLYFTDDKPTLELTAEQSAIIQPGETHWVEPQGPMQMQVDFYHAPPTP